MNEQNQFFKTTGGGQFFQKVGHPEGDLLKVICLYDFNPCIERMKFTPDILQSLKCVPCSETEFAEAEGRAVQMLGISVPVTHTLGKQPFAKAA
ncbi:MAG: hypothetical protein LH606_15835 [Cytophagaceae bacterium]|nr:hypothetical protein [Cytophagaceae bacterium]